jgi:hypothetical protein
MNLLKNTGKERQTTYTIFEARNLPRESSDDLETSDRKIIFVRNTHRSDHTLHHMQKLNDAIVDILIDFGHLKFSHPESSANGTDNAHTSCPSRIRKVRLEIGCKNGTQ